MRPSEFDSELTAASAKLYSFCRRLSVNHNQDVNDLHQETLTRAMEHYSRYTLETNMFAWLCQIAWNVVSMELKKAKNMPLESWEKAADEIEDNELHAIYMQDEGAIDTIWRVINRLSGKQLACMGLKIVGYSNPEIEELTCSTTANVKNSLSLARRNIKADLNKFYFN
jgi:RNA polymerase sigma factor (sigma-70 family)